MGNPKYSYNSEAFAKKLTLNIAVFSFLMDQEVIWGHTMLRTVLALVLSCSCDISFG